MIFNYILNELAVNSYLERSKPRPKLDWAIELESGEAIQLAMKESRLPNSRVSDNQNLEEVVVRRLSPHGQRLLLEPGGRLPSLTLRFLCNPPTNVFHFCHIHSAISCTSTWEHSSLSRRRQIPARAISEWVCARRWHLFFNSRLLLWSRTSK